MKFNFIFLVIVDIISIVVAYGSIIEIKGIISYLIFAVPFVLNIVFIKKYEKLFHQLLLAFIIFVYLSTGVIFLIREDGRKIINQIKSDKYIYLTYEVSPGAMGHISYIDKVYYSLIDTDFLTVRIVKNEKHYRYRGWKLTW